MSFRLQAPVTWAVLHYIPGAVRSMDAANWLSAMPADLERLERSPWIPTQMLLLPLNIPSLKIITIVPRVRSWGQKQLCSWCYVDKAERWALPQRDWAHFRNFCSRMLLKFNLFRGVVALLRQQNALGFLEGTRYILGLKDPGKKSLSTDLVVFFFSSTPCAHMDWCTTAMGS